MGRTLKEATIFCINIRHREGSGFIFQTGTKRSPFSNASGLTLGPTQTPIFCVQRVLLPGVKLNTNLHLVRNLRMHGAERLLALHAFTAYTGTIPNFYV